MLRSLALEFGRHRNVLTLNHGSASTMPSAMLYSTPASGPSSEPKATESKETAPEASPGGSSTSDAGTQQSSQAQAGAQVDEWTEVAHKESGQSYWWNQRSGATTNLGEPKPISAPFPSPPQEQETAAAAQPMNPGDGIGVYAIVGALSGLCAGWSTQFF